MASGHQAAGLANWYRGKTAKGPYDQIARVDDEFQDQPHPSHSGVAAIDGSQGNLEVSNQTARWKTSKTSPPHIQPIPDGTQPSPPTTPWLPYTLRSPWLSGIITYAFLLEIAVIIIHSISSRNFGLVDDNGSGGVVVGSRFVPTALAVIYVLWISILLDDIKRTEAFARLASPTGALAKSSLTWKADAWWNALSQSFPRRSRSRKINWPLLLSSLTFMLGFLAVSPLSSSLIVSQDVVFNRQAGFAQVNTASSMPLQANPLSSTYFRTISNILQNATTSAWLTEKYVVTPFWPNEINQAPLGPVIRNGIPETWTANTTVFSTELECENFEFTGVKTAELPSVEGLDPSIGVSVGLSSPSGCSIDLRLNNISTLATTGGGIWAAMGDIANLEPDQSSGNNLTTNACPQDELIIFVTPFSNGTDILSNATATGAACRAFYYVANALTTVALTEGRTNVSINERQYLATRTPILDNMINIPAFEDVFLGTNWTTHINTNKLAKTNRFDSPWAFGPANLLAALYNFSPEELVAGRNVTMNMRKVKQRFLAEVLRDAFEDSSNVAPLSIQGAVSNSKRRLVIVPAIAITIEVIIALQLLLLAAIFLYTRPAKRPLGLTADPASSMGLAKLLANEPETLQSLEYLYDKPTQQLNLELRGKRYQLTDRGIRLIANSDADNGYNPGSSSRQQDNPTAKPEKVFNFWVLLGFFVLLASILISIAVLYWYHNAYGLYQTAFVYAIDISVNGLDFGPVNPASIITTLIAVCIGLWWGSLDTTLRRVQPFLALAKEPVIGSKGVSLSYRSSYLLWAAFRAIKRRHLLLVLICTGAFFAEIFTIAMSSLWDRGPGYISSTIEIPRQLKLRNVPILSTGRLPSSPSSRSYKVGAISSLFSNMRTSWIYGAAVQLSLNGSEPSWSSDGWSFVPSDLSSIPEEQLQNIGNGTTALGLTMDVTLETSAIRGRLECSEYDFLSNTSMWLTEWDLKDAETWNISASPDVLDRGYGLGLPTERLDISAYSLQHTTFFLNPPSGVYDGSRNFSGDHTSFFVDSRRLQCCQNTTNGEIGETSIGYWSFNQPNGTSYPDVGDTWPTNFTVKFLRGRAVQGYKMTGEWPSDEARTHMIFAEEPRMAALNCMPIIETAPANVTVNSADGRVLDFTILDTPRPDEFAFRDDFAIYQTEDALASDSPKHYEANLTTSHGILFLLGLLGAADIDNFGGIAKGTVIPQGQLENVEDQTFTIRDPGINVDLSTYSMLSLVNNDHQALLDTETLKRTAQKTFTALFQHFVNNNLSPETGGYVYQSLNEKLPDEIGLPRVPPNNTPSEAQALPDTVTLHISRPVELLQMSKPAAWICMLLLGYLLITCVILAIASRQYNKLLPRGNVNSIADVAVLLAGSDKLLETAREKSLESIKYDPNSTAKLGWFQGGDGAVRWGIEYTDKEDTPDPLLQRGEDDLDDIEMRRYAT